MRDFKTTADVEVPKGVVDQVIGQDEAVKIIRTAAKQRRHIVLVGEPGTGKSMLGKALAELLPKGKLVDVLTIPNQLDTNRPIVKTLPAGKGRKLANQAKLKSMSGTKNQQMIFFVFAFIALMIPWWLRDMYGDIMAAASLIAGMMFVAALALSFGVMQRQGKSIEPKVIVDSSKAKGVPFIDATGAHAGALLGDVLHDPFQSGGLGTPPHLRVEAGMIHKAHGGVLFIDEVATLDLKTQQDLLTSLQEGKYPITGQSERSAGAMVRTEPVPCNFVLVAAGNVETIAKMHPALRSRIRGYGYEIYMNDSMNDLPANENMIARFVAQEVANDGKIPHFTKAAVKEILKIAKKRSGRKGKITIKLRDLGGVIRASGDVACDEGAKYVSSEHVLKALSTARSLEQQIADEYIDKKKEYEVIRTSGHAVGRVNGLAVIGDSGIILPIEAAVTPGGRRREIVATGKLGDIAKEAIENVSAIIMKYFGKDLKEKYDIYVQFLQTYEGVEGDSASISVATAIISAVANLPIRQDTALTGSLSVRGEVLPVGGVTAKVEAAIEAGMKRAIVPKANFKDVILPKGKKIKVIPAADVMDVLENALVWTGKEALLKKLKKV